MITIYNARTQQKWLTILSCAGMEFLLILGFFLGEIYNSRKDTLILLTLMLGVFLLSVVIYFLLIRFANSVFIVSETGFVRKINKIIVLEVKWDDVICIGTYHIYDFFHIDCGPLFLGIDYYDENHDQKTLNVSFSSKDAKRLKTSQIHKKLDTLSY